MADMDNAIWPAEPGTYVLLIDVTDPLRLIVGKLGCIELPPGRYAYVGSAHGSGGLHGRLTRHVRRDKQCHWHIDYLTDAVTKLYVYWEADAERLECRWAQRFTDLVGATVPAPGFGSSDCRNGCPAHLIRLPDGFSGSQLAEILQPD